MTLDEAASLGRFLTAAEFISFVEGQGWSFARVDGGAVIRGPGIKDDPVAVRTARLLSREPYRTNVLALLMARWRDAPAPAVGPPAPPPASWRDTPPEAREWLHRDGRVMDGGDWPPHAVYWWRVSVTGAGVGRIVTGWAPVEGRTPLCTLLSAGDTHGCDSRDCKGCLLAGGPFTPASLGVGPWSLAECLAGTRAADEAKRRGAGDAVVG